MSCISFLFCCCQKSTHSPSSIAPTVHHPVPPIAISPPYTTHSSTSLFSLASPHITSPTPSSTHVQEVAQTILNPPSEPTSPTLHTIITPSPRRSSLPSDFLAPPPFTVFSSRGGNKSPSSRVEDDITLEEFEKEASGEEPPPDISAFNSPERAETYLSSPDEMSGDNSSSSSSSKEIDPAGSRKERGPKKKGFEPYTLSKRKDLYEEGRYGITDSIGTHRTLRAYERE